MTFSNYAKIQTSAQNIAQTCNIMNSLQTEHVKKSIIMNSIELQEDLSKEQPVLGLSSTSSTTRSTVQFFLSGPLRPSRLIQWHNDTLIEIYYRNPSEIASMIHNFVSFVWLQRPSPQKNISHNQSIAAFAFSRPWAFFWLLLLKRHSPNLRFKKCCKMHFVMLANRSPTFDPY